MSKLHLPLIALLGFFVVAACDDEQHPTAAGSHANSALAAAAAPASVQVSVSDHHTCALGTDGAIRCFGWNEYGQAPVLRRAESGTYIQVSAADWHTCALRSDGPVECWGAVFPHSWEADEIVFQGKYIQVSTRPGATCLLNEVGTTGCSGEWDWSEEMAAGSGYAKLGEPAGCGLRTDGQVSCRYVYEWWDDSYGLGEWVYSTVEWRKAAPTGTYIQISGLCALRSTGEVDCWNNRGGGQSTTRASTGKFTQYSRGCGLRDDGVVECGTVTHTASTGLFTQISAGGGHACGLRNDGVIECWGDNTYGEAPGIGLSGPAPPRAPSNLFADVVSDTQADLSWTDRSINETSFTVERNSRYHHWDDGGPWVRIATLAANTTTFSDTTASTSSMYEYRVAACIQVACSQGAVFGPVELRYRSLSPAGVIATPDSSAGINVAWTDSSRAATSFRVMRIVRNEGTTQSWDLATTVGPGEVTRYEDRTAVAGTTYRYAVVACSSNGCSPWTRAPDVVAPGRPAAATNVTALAVSATRIDLSWTDASSDETRFILTRRFRNTDGSWSAWAHAATLAANATSYSNTGLAPGSYQHRVRACHVACSAYAATRETATLPAPPTTAGAAAVSSTTIQLTWTDASANETYFLLARRVRDANGTWSGFQPVPGARPVANSTTYADASAAPGTSYQYRVRACNTSGCSLPALTPVATTPGS
jgi:hypothetical protein